MFRDNKKKAHKLTLLLRLVNREYLAHVLAYEDLTDGASIVLPGVNSKPIEKVIVHKIETGCDGLVGYILEINDPSGAPRVEIIWRGTHNRSSMHMDLESGGPGAVSYEKARLRIIFQINTIIKHLYEKTGDRVIVGVSGHSLGGALAQRCFTDLAAAMVQNESFKNLHKNNTTIEVANKHGFTFDDRSAINLDKICKLELGAFNSAGVDNKTYENSKLFSEYLHRESFTITADYCLNDRDGVQQVGEKNILADCRFANVNLFKFNSPRNLAKQIAVGATIGGLSEAINRKVCSSKKNRALCSVLAGVFAVGGYKLAGTVMAHTTKHSILLENYNLALQTKDFKIFNNKLPDNKEIDRIGSNKIAQELLVNKSWFINNGVTDLLCRGLYFLAAPILNNKLVAKSEAANKTQQKTRDFIKTSMVGG
jgi:hypothetical protein